jgi:hypothetical protein
MDERIERSECCVFYEVTKYKTPCNHVVCNDCTDNMTINKELCCYCRQPRTDVCDHYKDRKLICVCCIRYLFKENIYYDDLSLRIKFWKIVQVCYTSVSLLYNKDLINFIEMVIDDFIFQMKNNLRDDTLTEYNVKEFKETILRYNENEIYIVTYHLS